jgi:predicted chitinase
MSVEAALRRAGVPSSIARAEAPRASKAMLEHDITTQRRACDFLAQVLHESVGLRYFEEIASGAAYEGRRDLGNTHPGDGVRYKGRGPIQLTGRANYRAYGHKLHLPLEAHPRLASRHDIGWRIAALYWQDNGLNQLADRGDFLTITRRINGGTNGWTSRVHYRTVLAGADCRPRRPNPYRHLGPNERRIAREYDHLKKHGVDIKRRRELRAQMTVMRKAIWRKAQPRSKGGDGLGWKAKHRLERYHALQSRST